MENQEIRKIQYVQMRLSLLGSFESLADLNFQMKDWIDPKYKHSFSDCIALCAFDGLNYLGEKKYAYERIGTDIYDAEEADAIQEYCQWFHYLYVEEIGEDQPDEAYYKHPKWSEAVEGALKVRKLMARKNRQNSFWRQLEKEDGDGCDEIQDQYYSQVDEDMLNVLQQNLEKYLAK